VLKKGRTYYWTITLADGRMRVDNTGDFRAPHNLTDVQAVEIISRHEAEKAGFNPARTTVVAFTIR
jgi:hypothetical protein